MTSPWMALLAGLGAGAKTLGDSLTQQEMLKLKAKQDADRAFQNMIPDMIKYGGRPVMPGTDPMQAVQQATGAIVDQGLGPQALQRLPGPGLTGGANTPQGMANPTPTDTSAPEGLMPEGRPFAVSALGMSGSFVVDPNTSDAAQTNKRALQRERSQEAMNTARQDALDKRASAAEKARSDLATQQATRTAQGDYQTLKALNPQHPLVQAPFNPDYAATYARELNAYHQTEAEKTKLNPPMTDYQRALLALQAQRIAQAGAKSGAPTPDQVKSQTVESLATPAADALSAYYQRKSAGSLKDGAGRTVAAFASHLPFGTGNAIEGAADADYQNAMNNARTLGTQYLEIMPKSRFQPSTIDDILKQIAPSLGDQPPVVAAKLARINVLKKAIQKRAALRPDAQGPDLTDIPEPPQ